MSKVTHENFRLATAPENCDFLRVYGLTTNDIKTIEPVWFDVQPPGMEESYVQLQFLVTLTEEGFKKYNQRLDKHRMSQC